MHFFYLFQLIKSNWILLLSQTLRNQSSNPWSSPTKPSLSQQILLHSHHRPIAYHHQTASTLLNNKYRHIPDMNDSDAALDAGKIAISDRKFINASQIFLLDIKIDRIQLSHKVISSLNDNWCCLSIEAWQLLQLEFGQICRAVYGSFRVTLKLQLANLRQSIAEQPVFDKILRFLLL